MRTKYLHPMKASLFFIALLAFGLTGFKIDHQGKKRSSPLMEKTATIGEAKVTLKYGAPYKKERVIFGELVPYGKIWRTGANEATVFEVDKEVVVQDKTLNAGKYAMFTIPGESEWVIVFNTQWDQWGAYKYDQSKDAIRVSVKPSSLNDPIEQMSMDIVENKLEFKWDKTAFTLEFQPFETLKPIEE